MPLLFKKYFKLKGFEKQQVQEGLSDLGGMSGRIQRNEPCCVSPQEVPLAPALSSYHSFHDFPLCIKLSIKTLRLNRFSGSSFHCEGSHIT